MNVKELRLGNWVEDETAGYVQVCMIDDPHVRAWADLDEESKYSFRFNSPDKDDFYADMLNPIPLTPELLVKAGFVYESIGHNDFDLIGSYQDSNGIVINQYLPGDFGMSYGENGNVTELKFTHQLQNLYFALTGEELAINLTFKETLHEVR